MKTKFTTPFLALAALAMASCSSEDAEVTTTDAATPYPLEVCIVSGEPLGSMGEPIVIVHEGQEIKFCCDACPPRFEEDPAKYLGKLEQ